MDRAARTAVGRALAAGAGALIWHDCSNCHPGLGPTTA